MAIDLFKRNPIHPGSIATIAANVFRESIRDRILYLIGLYALALVAAVALLPKVSAGTESKIILDVGLAAMELLALVVTIFVGTALINKEIDKRTVLILVSKPISRAEFVLGKFLGLSAVIAVLVALMTLLYCVFFSFSGINYPLGSILLAALYLFFKLGLIIAVAVLFGVFMSSLLATILTIAIYLVGNFSRSLLELGQTIDSTGLQAILTGLYLVLPDLSRLDLKNDAVYGSAALPDIGTLLFNVGYGIVYAAFLLAIAILIFSRREF
jgi:ABC-type transport system involved in multi-copper enzyme maturation permease subunit